MQLQRHSGRKMFSKRIKEIELFGRKLLISERTQKDVAALARFAETVKDNKTMAMLMFIRVISDALKINLDILKKRNFLKRFRFKRMLKINYLLKHLTLKQIIDNYNLVIEELEMTDTKVKGSPISETYQEALISQISNLPIDEIKDLPITKYRELLELAFNWGSYLRGTEFNMLSSIDKRMELIKEHKQLFPEMWN